MYILPKSRKSVEERESVKSEEPLKDLLMVEREYCSEKMGKVK